MRLTPARMTAALVIATTAATAQPAQVRPTGSQPSVKWVGQDGHDYVGPNNRLEPSEVQDMHFVLSGLDPQQEISFVDVTTGQGGDQWQYNAPSFAWKAELKRPRARAWPTSSSSRATSRRLGIIMSFSVMIMERPMSSTSAAAR